MAFSRPAEPRHRHSPSHHGPNSPRQLAPSASRPTSTSPQDGRTSSSIFIRPSPLSLNTTIPQPPMQEQEPTSHKNVFASSTSSFDMVRGPAESPRAAHSDQPKTKKRKGPLTSMTTHSDRQYNCLSPPSTVDTEAEALGLRKAENSRLSRRRASPHNHTTSFLVETDEEDEEERDLKRSDPTRPVAKFQANSRPPDPAKFTMLYNATQVLLRGFPEAHNNTND